MKAEEKLKLSIDALTNFGVYKEIIEDMRNDLNKLIIEKQSEMIAKDHFRKQRDDSAIEAYNTSSVITCILEICNEEYSADEKINDILKQLKQL